MPFSEAWRLVRLVITEYQRHCPAFAMLTNITAVMLACSVSCDHGSITQNMMKTKMWPCLMDVHVDNPLLIPSQGYGCWSCCLSDRHIIPQLTWWAEVVVCSSNMLVVHICFCFLRHCICCVQVCWLDIFSFSFKTTAFVACKFLKVLFLIAIVKCSYCLIQTYWPVVKFACASTCPYWVKHVFLLPFSSPVTFFHPPCCLYFLTEADLSDSSGHGFQVLLATDLERAVSSAFLFFVFQADWYAVSLMYVNLRALRVRLGALEMFVIIIVLISGGCWGHLSAIGKGFAKTTAGAIS